MSLVVAISRILLLKRSNAKALNSQRIIDDLLTYIYCIQYIYTQCTVQLSVTGTVEVIKSEVRSIGYRFHK
jgi:hypothetical protein